jgi:hypothetical protein
LFCWVSDRERRATVKRVGWKLPKTIVEQQQMDLWRGHGNHWLLVNYYKESIDLGGASSLDYWSTSIITACCPAIIQQRKRTILSGKRDFDNFRVRSAQDWAYAR